VFESTAENQTLVVALNQAAQPVQLKVPPSVSVLVSGNSHFAGNNLLALPARGWAVLPPAADQARHEPCVGGRTTL
jgi:hypothetical protein